jgi:hypothetical protein
MRTIKITVKPQDNLYAAEGVEGNSTTDGLGASPDEAIGNCIREMWLGGAFEKPIFKLVLDLQTND